jgi:hypothetical protein
MRWLTLHTGSLLVTALFLAVFGQWAPVLVAVPGALVTIVVFRWCSLGAGLAALFLPSGGAATWIGRGAGALGLALC